MTIVGRDYGTPPFPVIELNIIGQLPDKFAKVTGLVESGADATMIPSHILQSIDARQLDTGWVHTVSGQRYAINIYAVTIEIGEHKLYGIEVIANEKTDEVIIGRDVLNQLMVTLDGLGEVTEVHF